MPAFRPGQFLHLALDAYDPSGFWPESRVFSIASAPTERRSLRISYSVKGVFTSRMERELQVGREVWVKLPYGDFVVRAANAVLIAGGTGITAFQAFVAGLAPAAPGRIVLLYGARKPSLLLDSAAFREKALAQQNFKVHFFAEEQAGAAGDVLPGRIRLDVLNDCSAVETAVYFLAGPPGMISMFTGELAGRGIGPERIVVDAWE